ncbi:MAG TPA: ATP-binding protein [Micromonosporaceae bacterium]|nr:ATP-binding protein [Micromonosporaceae bacterium]
MKRPSDWSLSARITALCLPAVVLLTLLAVGAAITANENSHQLSVLLNQIGPLRTNTQQLEVQMLNQETGIRGYAIESSQAALQPYTDGVTQQRALVSQLRGLAAHRPEVRADLAAAEAAIADWQAKVAQPVIDAVQAGDHATALSLIDPDSRGQFDTVRDRLDTMDNDVTALRNSGVSDVQRLSHAIVWALIASGIVIVIAGFILAVLLRLMVRNPVARLAESVRQVAAGDYNQTVDVAGPPEVASLGADVEEMRHRIVADLRVVQAANDAVERANADLASANAQLESQAVDLQRSNQDLEQFAYVASHDLQEPLRKVASFCQLLQRRYAGQLDERADQYISFAVDGAHRMQRLINDLLKFSRIGRVTSDFTDVDLGAIVAAAADANDDALARVDGTVEALDLPTVRGDEGLLVGLFANLISNSIKFHQVDTPVRIRVSADEHDDEWRITFRDNGIGIDPDYADKVFVIFQRLHARDAYPGTGIGLAVAKRIVEYHGGRIWVDTNVDDGAAICFTVRAAPPTVEQRAAVEQPVAQAVDALNTAH